MNLLPLLNIQVFNNPGEYIYNQDRIPPAMSVVLWAIGISIFLFVLGFVIFPCIMQVIEQWQESKIKQRKKENGHISEKCKILYPYKNDGYDITIYHGVIMHDGPAKTQRKIKSLMLYPLNALAYIDMNDDFRLVTDWIGYQVKEAYGPTHFTNLQDLQKAAETNLEGEHE